MADVPDDFERVAAFHGHVCGGLTIGYRLVKAGMAWLGAERAEDEELVAVIENDSCAADAVQVIAGCTFGKGNLIFRDYGKMALTIWSRQTQRGVRISRRDHTRGRPIEEMLAMSDEELLDVRPVDAEPPEEARIRDSEPCAQCSELTMVSRLRDTSQGRLCIPCAQSLDP